MEEVAAFCDEPPSVIVSVLERTGGAVTRVPDVLTELWRVQDAGSLQRQVAGDRSTRGGSTREVVDVRPATRLQYAEQTLMECGKLHTSDERRVLLSTALNHLRQVIANTVPSITSWWAFDLSPADLVAVLRDHTDPATSSRLLLDVEVAVLTEHELRGRPIDTQDLTETVQRLEPLTAELTAQALDAVIGRFFDLVMAQVVPPGHGPLEASKRLLTTVARRRVRAQVERSVEAALSSLVPLLQNIGRDAGDRQPELYQVVRDMPDGRQRLVVYSDLLPLLPQQFRWQAEGERLPGALTEVVTEPETTQRLRTSARALEQDLSGSPYGSEAALIGSVVHVLQQLTDEQITDARSRSDAELRTRSDRTCSELLTLAKVLTPA